jgi:Holliday junction resolvasome RuvABC endonuclease subunit
MNDQETSNIIGFDASTKHIHYAVVCGMQVLSCGELIDDGHVKELVREYELETAYIEAVPFVHNHQTAIKLAMVIGTLKQRLEYMGINYVCLVSVAEWKKALTGKGNASKCEVKEKVIAITGLGPGWPQDVYDATGVAMAGCEIEKRERTAAGLMPKRR